MRLLHFLDSTRSELGGPVRAVIDLCGAMALRGHQVTLLTFDDSGVPADWRDSLPGLPRVVRVHRPLPGRLLSPAALGLVRREIERADAVHLHGVWNPFNIQAASEARRLGVPYIVTAHGMLDDWSMAQKPLKKRVYMGLAGRRWLEGAASVHVTARSEFEQARKWFPRGRASIMPYLLDIGPFESLPGPGLARSRFPLLNGGEPTLLFLSRLHYKKGIEHLLRALKRLVDGGQPCNLIIAGTGEPAYVESLHRLARGLGVTDRVEFVGHVTGREKLSLYQAADLFVLPTSQENFGLVFVEALACATPVVTTRGVDVWQDLVEGGGAAVTDAEPADLAATLGSLLSEPQRLARMGAAGRRWVFDYLDPDSVAMQAERMYERAIADSARPVPVRRPVFAPVRPAASPAVV